MSKHLYLLWINIIAWLYAQPTLAQDSTGSAGADGLGSAFGSMLEQAGQAAKYKTGDSAQLTDILSGVILTILSLLGVIFLIMILYAGIRWMTAGGREEVLSKAKDSIKQAIIGLLIVAGAYAISWFFFSVWQSAGN